jgi:hypothetical protein
MSRLKWLRRLSNLKSIIGGRKAGIDTTKLESDFLAFSSNCPRSALAIKKPRMYTLRGDEKEQFRAALNALGEESAEVPRAIDFSGGFGHAALHDAMIFMSLRQVNADHCSTTRSYLNPLAEKVFSEGSQMMREFAIYEAVCGRVKSMRGSLDLKEAHLFPERFFPGPYKLTVELDTPTGKVQEFMDLTALLAEFREKPKECMLDPAKVSGAAKKAVSLRQTLGSLSRYQSPETRTYEAETHSCVLKANGTTHFYLFSEDTGKNALVYFGQSPFPEGGEPNDLLVIDGRGQEEALAKLLSMKIFDPSMHVLEQRIGELTKMYEDTARQQGKSLNGSYPEFSTLMKELKKAGEYFRRVSNKDMRRAHLGQLSAELLEFMVCPASNDPIVHELLPMVSWNAALRRYHDTAGFIAGFEAADEAGRKRMLEQSVSSIIFGNHQNYDANLWLYNSHRDFCEQAGVKFEIV